MTRRVLAMATAGLILAVLAERSMFGAGDIRVRVESGELRGVTTLDGAVRGYKGIPFAAPPVGVLRWRPPQAPARWNGVRPADAFAPSCLQPPREGAAARLFTSQRLGASNEDCLYLNVWTAAGAREQLPVMVWFPGGGFATGGGSALAFDGEALARKHVVIVTTNYRLGLLGFFAHPELLREARGDATGISTCTGPTRIARWRRRCRRTGSTSPHQEIQMVTASRRGRVTIAPRGTRVMEFGDAVRFGVSGLNESKIRWFDAFRESLQ